jgi:hypothetical protein
MPVSDWIASGLPFAIPSKGSKAPRNDQGAGDRIVTKGVDIIETGTPMLLRFGLDAATTIKKAYPKHEILSDTKLMDGGEPEARYAFYTNEDAGLGGFRAMDRYVK